MSLSGGAGLTQRTLAGLLWTAWGRVAYVAAQVLVLAALSRLLSPAEFGVVSAALVVIGLSGIFAQLGMGPALVQRAELEPRHLDAAAVASVAFGLALAAGVWLGAPLASAFFRSPEVGPVLRVLSVVFPLQAVALVHESLARRELRFRWLANLDVVSYAVGYGLIGVPLAALGWGPWALVAAEVGKTGLRTAALIAGHRVRLGVRMERAALRELLHFGGGFTLARVANYLAVQGDNLVVGRTLGPAALGLYGRAYQLMVAPAQNLGGVLDTVLFPVMAKVQDDPARLAAAYRRGVALLATATLPLSGVLVVLAPEVVRVALGPRWAAVVPAFQILAVGLMFRTSYKISDTLCRSTGAVYRRAWRQVIYAALVIGGALAGQRWGISGVAVGVVAALLVNFFMMAQLSLELARLTWRSFWEAHLPAVRLAAVTTPLAWVAAEAARAAGVPAVVGAGATLALVLGAALALGALAPGAFAGEDVLWLVGTMRARMSRRPRAARTRAVPLPDVGGAP